MPALDPSTAAVRRPRRVAFTGERSVTGPAADRSSQWRIEVADDGGAVLATNVADAPRLVPGVGQLGWSGQPGQTLLDGQVFLPVRRDRLETWLLTGPTASAGQAGGYRRCSRRGSAKGDNVVEDSDVERVVEYVHEQLPADWAQWPGGWPGEAEAALLDAVLSIQAVYGGPQTGVRGAIGRWRQHRGGVPLDDLGALASIGPEDLAQVLNNRQRLSEGRLKAEAIADAADRLVKAGMRSSADLDGGRGKYRRAYVAVRGLGTVTWDYLCMLLGVDGVKADVWVVRFVSRALRDDTGDSSRDPAYCGELLRLAAAQLQVPATKLDHAVWAQMRQVGPADQRSTH